MSNVSGSDAEPVGSSPNDQSVAGPTPTPSVPPSGAPVAGDIGAIPINRRMRKEVADALSLLDYAVETGFKTEDSRTSPRQSSRALRPLR